MAKKGPLDDVFEQIASLMNQIDQNGDQLKEGKLDPSILQQVNDLKEFIGEFKETSDDLFREAGIDPDKLAQKGSWKDAPSKAEREMLERLEGMKQDLTQRKQVYQKAIDEAVAEKNVSSEGAEDSQQLRAKRKRKLKKKFRGMGGDKWMKM